MKRQRCDKPLASSTKRGRPSSTRGTRCWEGVKSLSSSNGLLNNQLKVLAEAKATVGAPRPVQAAAPLIPTLALALDFCLYHVCGVLDYGVLDTAHRDRPMGFRYVQRLGIYLQTRQRQPVTR